MKLFCIYSLIFIFLISCSSKSPAPVVYKITPILKEVLQNEKSKNKSKNNKIIKHSDNYVIVKKGDSIKKFSENYKISINDILLLNDIKNPDKIFIGQRIILPKKMNNLIELSKKNKNMNKK